MTQTIEQLIAELRDEEIHTFDGFTVADVLEQLTARVRELEAEIVRLRECLEWALCNISAEPFEWCCDEDSTAHYAAIAALSTPLTPQALPELIAKASEVMRQRAISAGSAINPIYGAGAAIDAIRAIPNVTLEELL